MGFFSWEATWGRVLTLDQLKCWRRVLANRCYLCEEDEETIEHLLVHCKKAKMLWDLFLLIVGTNWVFPSSVLHTLLSCKGATVGKKRKKIWLVASLYLFWILWRERNRVTFENDVTSSQRTKTTFLSNLWSWANLCSVDNTNSFLDFF